MQIKTLDFFKLPEGLRVPFFGGKIYNFISKLERKYIRKLSINNFALNDTPRDKKIIVSLTSFPARIDTVGFAIKSLFNQTVKPDRIILWLATEQFENSELPELLEKLKEKGLEIRFCEDLKSHKKYHYALKEQRPDELIITYDDDIIYPENSIELLYKTHIKFPNCIICNYSGQCLQENGVFLPYKTWKTFSSVGVQKPTMQVFPFTGGGVLYPFESVNREAFNIDTMKKIALTADDLWMRYMSALNKTKVVKTTKCHKPFSLVTTVQNDTLSDYNCLHNGNDIVLNNLQKKYPDVFKIIFND